ncbi:MAG: yhhW 3 [Ilumatobacteraceae bacterium]|nr:yhhW 3 [Ilumatobacteraceae bacterium]
MSITIQQPEDRFVTDIGWLDSKHSMNFGEHFDRQHGQHGLLLVNNDDIVAPSAGFGTHGHRDMEIVTWVLSGQVAHRDSEGNNGVLYPGLAQRMSAGSGIRHSEMNPSPDEAAHFIQMWVLPDTNGIKPGYQQLDINGELAKGGLVRSRRARATTQPSASTSATPCCGARGCRPASRWCCPMIRTCTRSSRSGPPHSRRASPSPRAQRHG